MKLTFRDIARDGQGIGLDEEGKVRFCPGALPGEIWEAVPAEKNSCRGIELILASPDRTEPPCPCFKDCGGCQLQHMTYGATLKLKHDQVRQTLERLGGMPAALLDAADQCADGRAFGSPLPFHYRNHVRFHVRNVDGKVETGFLRAGSHELISFERDGCLLAAPIAETARQAFLNYVREPGFDLSLLPPALQIRHSEAEREVLITLHFDLRQLKKQTNKLRAAWSSWARSLDLGDFTLAGLGAVGEAPPKGRRETMSLIFTGRDHLRERLGENLCLVEQEAFFQVNSPQAERLGQAVYELASPEAGMEIWDIYGGTGTLGLPFARSGLTVRVAELHPTSEYFGKLQAEENGLSERMRFYRGDAAKVIPDLIGEGFCPDIILTDPPRAGLTPSLIEDLSSLRAGRWVYVSCDPATLARDLKKARELGWEIRAFRVFDMFPWTTHVETVVLMSKEEH